MPATHQLTDTDRNAWLARNTFDCPVYRARLSPQQCAANRKRPLLTDKVGCDGMTPVLHRKPGCGEGCAAWSAERDRKVSKPSSGGIDACANCGRRNMSSPARGLCGACNTLAVRGNIAKGEDGEWREVLVQGAVPQYDGLVPAELPPPKSGEKAPVGCSEPAPAPQIVHGDKVPLTIMGADPAEQLINTDEARELLAKVESAAPDLDAWDFYDPRAQRPAFPAVWVTKDLELCINSEAVQEYRLPDHTHVRLGLHRSSGAVCLQPVHAPDGALSLRTQKGRECRYVSGKGFFDRHGLRPVCGKPYPISSGTGGMLVITIEMQAAEQLQEAS